MIVSVLGKARSGKNTFAEILAEELFDITKRKFIFMAFAHELKLRVQTEFDLSYEQLWGNQKEAPDHRYQKNNSNNIFWAPREILQEYGELYRKIDYDFWVKSLLRLIDEKEYKNVIITDVRYPNEADAITKRKGFIIKVTSERDGKEQIHGQDHISETALDNYDNIDFHVTNDGTIQDLRITAKQVAKFIIDSQKIR